jgi:uncharacterized protein YegJ (DUF2314 family)
MVISNKLLKQMNDYYGQEYIKRDPLESEEAESDDNLLLSCEAHGKETYFNIKKMEKKPSMRNYVYVWFKRKKQAEKMWVRILKGTQKEGLGKLDNIPAFLDHLELGQTIKFKTDKEGITWQKK